MAVGGAILGLLLILLLLFNVKMNARNGMSQVKSTTAYQFDYLISCAAHLTLSENLLIESKYQHGLCMRGIYIPIFDTYVDWRSLIFEYTYLQLSRL